MLSVDIFAFWVIIDLKKNLIWVKGSYVHRKWYLWSSCTMFACSFMTEWSVFPQRTTKIKPKNTKTVKESVCRNVRTFCILKVKKNIWKCVHCKLNKWLKSPTVQKNPWVKDQNKLKSSFSQYLFDVRCQTLSDLWFILEKMRMEQSRLFLHCLGCKEASTNFLCVRVRGGWPPTGWSRSSICRHGNPGCLVSPTLPGRLTQRLKEHGTAEWVT